MKMLNIEFLITFVFTVFSTDITCRRIEIMRRISPSRGEFPYMCSVLHVKKYFVGACSILTDRVVIVSVSNMNKFIPKENIRFYNDIGSLVVYAGSAYMDPDYGDLVLGSVKHAVQSFHLASNYSRLGEDPKPEIKPPGDKDVNLNALLAFDVVGVAFNVGFLKVEQFKWSYSLKPLPFNIANHQDTIRLRDDMDENPYLHSACRIAAWNTTTTRKIFHYVMYIPRWLCKRAYCDFNLRACHHFPLGADQEYHVCFKSAYWGEPCSSDTGAALFCKFFGGGNIFAILTTAINCGVNNLPCVYTLMPSVLRVYKTIFGDYVPPVVNVN